MMNNKLAKLYLLGLVTAVTLGVTYAYSSISNSLNYLRNEAGDTGHIGYIITEMFGGDDKIDREYLDLPSGLVINDATTSVTGIVMLEENTGSILTTKAPTSRILTQVWNNLNTRINSLVSTALTIETDPVWISASGSYYTKTQVDSNLALKAPIASPTLTGSPKSNEVLNVTDNDSSLATTSFVKNIVSAATATTTTGTNSSENCYYTTSTSCRFGYAFAPGTYVGGGASNVSHNICCYDASSPSTTYFWSNYAINGFCDITSLTKKLACVRDYDAFIVSDSNCSGTASVLSCSPGDKNRASEYIIYAGTLNGYKYFTTPGGWTDSTTPACAGGTDTLKKQWNYGNASRTTTSISSAKEGAGNTTSLATTKDADSSNLGTQPHLAAKYCYDLVYGGYSDWFLPAKDELNLLYTNKSAIGGFHPHDYWSSTETNSYTAWSQHFTNGTQDIGGYNKNQPYFIRCIRKF